MLKHLIRVLAIAGVYLCLARFGLGFAARHGSVAPIFPATGFAVGILLLKGRAFWPAVLLGAFCANAASGIPFAAVVGIAIGNTLEALVAHRILTLKRWKGPLVEEFGENVSIVAAGAIGALVSAAVGTGSLVAFGATNIEQLGALMWTWFAGNLIGVLVLVPLFSYFNRRKGTLRGISDLSKAARSAALLALFLAASVGIFFARPTEFLYFLLFPLLLAVAFLGTELCVLASVLIAACVALNATALGFGPFGQGVSAENFGHLQLFMLSFCITALGLLCIRKLKDLRLAIAILLAGWAFSAGLVGYLHGETRLREETRFLTIVKEVEGRFKHRLRIYEDALRSGGSLFRASETVSLQEWRDFVSSLDLSSRYPGIHGMGVVWPVRKSAEVDFLASRRLDISPEFSIKRVPGVSGVEADDEFIISYIEPLEANHPALGLDIGSEHARRAAAERARDTGEPAMTSKVALVQDATKSPGFLLLVPFYRELLSKTATVEERREKFRGWTYAPFLTRSFFAGMEGSGVKEVNIRVFDAPVQSESNLIYSSFEGAAASVELERVLSMAGLDLTIRWSRGVNFWSEPHDAEFWSGTCATLLTLMLSMVVASLSMLRLKTERLVEERTAALKASEQEARELAQQFRIASTAKSTFLANMSHEIRTPLNGIVGMSALLLESEINAEQRDFLQSIRTCSDSLLTIINDILDFSKIEAGKLSIVPAPFKVRALLKGIVTILASRVTEKKLEVATSVDETIPENLIGDKTRIGQVLLNLLGNAVKFTPIGGGIVIRVRLVEMSGEDFNVEFSVADTGIGIAREKLAAIFEPFEQVDGSTTRKFGGTGLGLSISKQLVGLMGGEIAVKSSPGSGSKFSFVLRLGHSKEDASSDGRETSSGSSARPLSVLLVEDNPINQRVAKSFLEKLGHSVTVAQNGKEAVELVQRGTESSFDMILMDCQMPIMNGFEATKLVRAYEKSAGGRIPIIALTANAMDGDRDLCINAGMDDYLAKPFDSERFAALIHKWTRPD